MKSIWNPNPYAGDARGLRLDGHWEETHIPDEGPQSRWVCDQWELPEWRTR